ncbi:hypothetical protein BV20DRAFT_798047 [Pilatotrama ljubarskyi]|nr:hypothetical protein BV20DRAFT_798047 [Pilatotrama ljubarskyi]
MLSDSPTCTAIRFSFSLTFLCSSCAIVTTTVSIAMALLYAIPFHATLCTSGLLSMSSVWTVPDSRSSPSRWHSAESVPSIRRLRARTRIIHGVRGATLFELLLDPLISRACVGGRW